MTATQLANLNRNGRKPGSRNSATAVAERVRKAAAAKTAKAVKVLASIMLDEEQPAAVRVRAATALLDRAVGRPRQALEHSGTVQYEGQVISAEEYERISARAAGRPPEPDLDVYGNPYLPA